MLSTTAAASLTVAVAEVSVDEEDWDDEDWDEEDDELFDPEPFELPHAAVARPRIRTAAGAERRRMRMGANTAAS